MTDVGQDLIDLQSKIARLTRDKDRAEGVVEAAKKELKEKYGVESVEEAERKAKEYEEEAEGLQKEMEELVERIHKDYGELLSHA